MILKRRKEDHQQQSKPPRRTGPADCEIDLRREHIAQARRELDQTWTPEMDRYTCEKKLAERFELAERDVRLLLAEQTARHEIIAAGLNSKNITADVDRLLQI